MYKKPIIVFEGVEGSGKSLHINSVASYLKKKDRKYVGDIRNGLPNGQGTLIFPDGDKYVGKFKDGERKGQGTLTFPDGTKGIGEFREGRPWNITHRDKNGNIIVKFVNGKQIKP